MKLYSPGFLLLVFSTLAFAQQQPPIPTLTTDDIVVAGPAVPATATTPEKPVIKNASNTDKPGAKNEAISEPGKEAGDPKKAAASDWNERLKQAQEKANGLERQADQSELEITRLRNQLANTEAKSPETRGQLNAQISVVTAQMQKLRSEAKIAQQLVSDLTAEGNVNNYKVAETALTNEKGEPDAKAKQELQEKTQTEINDAKAKIEVLQLRLRNNQAEILRNGNGDNFTLNRLRAEKEQVNEEIEKTRTKIEELTRKIYANR